MADLMNKEVWTLAEMLEKMPVVKLMRVKDDFGVDSPEFRQMELECQIQSAKDEARYQAIKADNQARLYEQGY